MDAHATFSISLTQSDSLLDSLVTAAPTPERAIPPCQAKQLLPRQRQELAIQVLAGTTPVSELARQHDVSRKFLYHQAHTAEQALNQAFAPPPPNDDVLFYLPVTRSWLRQLVLALVLIGHCSYRGVVELFNDLLDTSISVGTVHNIVRSAVTQAQRCNRQYDLSPIKIGLHDEIFQASAPVLVGVDAASTFCYLLSLEQHRDADTWGVRLLELTDRGFAPEATVADGGTGLRAGQKLALPEVPCGGDVFHLVHGGQALLRFLEHRAYKALAACATRPRKRSEPSQPDPSHADTERERQAAQATCDAAIRLYDEFALLLDWLRRDILAVGGPCAAERGALYDFVLAELKARIPLCPHRLQPFYSTLKNQRDDFLAFARRLDDGLSLLAEEFQVAPALLRRMLLTLARDDRDPRRWSEESDLRHILRGRYWEVSEAIAALGSKTVRASSLVENLNSRLRNYFFLRRHLGADYLDLLQFFLNHRRLVRSDRPERVGKSPAELLTRQAHPHWLYLLGYERFARN